MSKNVPKVNIFSFGGVFDLYFLSLSHKIVEKSMYECYNNADKTLWRRNP